MDVVKIKIKMSRCGILFAVSTRQKKALHSYARLYVLAKNTAKCNWTRETAQRQREWARTKKIFQIEWVKVRQSIT